ncbi:unnamed protein product [Phytomonas sp. Hart1]|nr:unnamed protein product [Phytomonas sp. Hart1]|eukprot:CCW68301.1 unnamed protein product [Phytomonas sp. isolate Hart1]
MLLCNFSSISLVSGSITDSEIDINGCTFFWDAILKQQNLKLIVLNGILKSMEDTVNDPKVNININFIDTSGPKLRIKYSSSNYDKAKPDIFIDKPAKHIDTVIQGLITAGGMSKYDNVIPKEYYFRKVLEPSPNIVDVFATLVTSYEVFLSGFYEDWTQVMATAQSELTKAMEESIITLFYRMFETIKVEIERLEPLTTSLIENTKGDKAAIRIHVIITQESNKKGLHLYDEFEANSMMLLLNCTEIELIYQKHAKTIGKNPKIYVISVRDTPFHEKPFYIEYSLLLYALVICVVMIMIIVLITVMYIILKTGKPKKEGKKKSR